MSTTDSITEIRSALEEKQAFLREGLEKGVKIDGDTIEMKGGDYSAMQKAVADIRELKSLAEMHTMADEAKDILADLSRPVSESAAVAAAAGGNFQAARSLGSRFVQSDEFKSLQASGRLTMDTPYTVEGEADITSGYSQKDVFTGSLSGAVNPRGFGRVQFDPAIPRAQRQTRVRDLFPVASTSANLIDYFRVKGFVENAGAGNAGTVADRTGTEGSGAVFGLKPKSTLLFESAQAPVRTIAHWEAAHRNVLRDEPQLQSTIDNELLYGLALAEDDQILNGDGTGENLLGILNTPGIQEYAIQAGDQRSDALRRSATLSILANFPGTGFVLHPLDWEEIELQKASAGGDGQYMLVSNVAIGAQTSVWRQPVVESPAMTEGEWLTGAFGLGAQLYDREIANVRIAEQHADFFVRNAIAILAEERLALAVKRPESFVHGSFTVTP